MSIEQGRQSPDRHKRVKRLKRLILIVLFLVILIPNVICVLLMNRMNTLEREIKSLSELITAYEQEIITVEGSLEEQKSDSGEAAEPGLLEEETTESSLNDVSEPDPETLDNLRKVYLTFDDGPSIYTNEILDILQEYDVKATFFVVGKDSEEAREAYKRIVTEGHTLGMHSYSHQYSEIYASVDAFSQDMNKLRSYLLEVTGVESELIRFPGGSSNTVSKVDMENLIAFLNQENITYFDWNISSKDASSTRISAKQILQNCTERLADYQEAVILMHDASDKSTTVEALPLLIEEIQKMEDTVILPITDMTTPVQHITIEQEGTED